MGINARVKNCVVVLTCAGRGREPDLGRGADCDSEAAAGRSRQRSVGGVQRVGAGQVDLAAGERRHSVDRGERGVRISDADVGHLLRAADLYVQASHVETGPLVVLEAMAVGLPVVGTICGSMPDFIVPGVTGELVPPGKPEALGDAITGVLRHAERRREMGLQGRKRFVSQFSADVNIPKIESILAEATGRA